MIKLPSIEIIFKQLAGTLIERSARGIAILIIKDNTDTSFTFKQYNSIVVAEADKDKYTAANYQYIKDIFDFAPYKVAVARIGTTGAIADALAIIAGNIKTGWITIADGTTGDYDTLTSWIKTMETARKTYKAVVYKVAAPDCKHVVNFHNDTVEFMDERGEEAGSAYCPSLIGILASCNVKRGATYFKCKNLKRVVEMADNEAAVGSGKFVLINDVDTVKIALGINSMTTTDGITATEDMKFIDTVEAMDMINDDISSVFQNEYLGNYKNNYDNQVLFISAVNSYFDQLVEDYILDNNYQNRAGVNIEAQRTAWISAGKADAENWTDAQVKNNAFKRTMFLAGDIKILGALENLKFNISLF